MTITTTPTTADQVAELRRQRQTLALDALTDAAAAERLAAIELAILEGERQLERTALADQERARRAAITLAEAADQRRQELEAEAHAAEAHRRRALAVVRARTHDLTAAIRAVLEAAEAVDAPSVSLGRTPPGASVWDTQLRVADWVLWELAAAGLRDVLETHDGTFGRGLGDEEAPR